MMGLVGLSRFVKASLLGMLFSVCISSVNAADVVILNAMARAVPPTSTNTAAFMTLKNVGKDDIRLVSVDSSVAERVEIHGHRHEGNKMMMYEVEDLVLPADKVVKLESGGYHIMIMGLKKTLKEGEKVPLTLHFSDSDAIDILAPVKPLMETLSKDPHGHMSH
ncbi:copper chaperone PCu(A)C [Endozoicomonas montiporae]|uniref:Copper chaperone PCu(A)C n=1 Tax=Endozoicomonas montiporae CL-33 TaxID=570277 RepID=A0A142BA27_9GAMM|nr:copper chaperone PCu(A)C [Endozoicomonas montiporae]AMO55603.1 hypothetical protein EZMO1_1432 [Endozoicomonas montiporae CL-33]